MNNTTLELIKNLKKVKAFFKRHAWGQGSRIILRDGAKPAYCMIGAIERVTKEYSPEYNILKNTVADTCRRVYGTGIIGTNDAKERTRKDMLNIVDVAIKTTEQKLNQKT